jgi:hypothetical protein
MAVSTANVKRISAMFASRGAPSFEPLSRQYKDASNLQARSNLHGRFRTNRYGWMRWIFDHFAQIERHRYEDSLAVTETAPLFAYVLSVLGARDALSDAAIARLHRQIDERIAVTGVFRITKSQGLFVARRAGA